MAERSINLSHRLSDIVELGVNKSSLILSSADKVISSLERVTIVESRSRELRQAREWLKEGSLLVYFAPHTTTLEPVEITDQLLLPELRMGKDQIIAWFVSAKFTGEVKTSDMGIFSKVTKYYENSRGIMLLPVVQDYLVEQGAIDSADAARVNKRSILAAIRLLQSKQNILAVAPEGTRRQTGGVHRAEGNLGRLLDSHSDTPIAVLPIYMEGAQQIQHPANRGLRQFAPWSSVTMNVGTLLQAEELDSIASQYSWKDSDMGEFNRADALMMHLLDRPLEPWMPGVDPRGVYAWNNLVDLRFPRRTS